MANEEVERSTKQPAFRRGAKFVFVRPTYLRGEVQKVGNDVPEGTRLSILRKLHQRKRIGPDGSAWTEQRIGFFERRVDQQSEYLSQAKVGGVFAPLAGSGNSDLDELIKLQEAEAAADGEGSSETSYKHVGGGFYEVTIDGETQKVRGKEEVSKLLGVEI